MSRYFLAIDIGASSGRHILGSVENGKIVLEEVYRFWNGMDHVDGTLCWEVVASEYSCTFFPLNLKWK